MHNTTMWVFFSVNMQVSGEQTDRLIIGFVQKLVPKKRTLIFTRLN